MKTVHKIFGKFEEQVYKQFENCTQRIETVLYADITKTVETIDKVHKNY